MEAWWHGGVDPTPEALASGLGVCWAFTGGLFARAALRGGCRAWKAALLVLLWPALLAGRRRPRLVRWLLR